MDVHPPKNGINRYWSIAIYIYIYPLSFEPTSIIVVRLRNGHGVPLGVVAGLTKLAEAPCFSAIENWEKTQPSKIGFSLKLNATCGLYIYKCSIYIYIFINIWVIWAICGLYGLYMEFNHVGATRSIVDAMVHFLWTLSIWHFFSPTGTLHSQDFHGFSALPNPGFGMKTKIFHLF